MSLPAGTHLGRYQILGFLGAGGMGEVYRARDTQLHREVALKIVLEAVSGDTAAEARFQREARAIASVNHPNICAVHDVGVDAGRRFLVMELLEGETLQQRLSRGPFEIPALLEHGIALADALHAAHAREIIHRDLKPASARKPSSFGSNMKSR
jgi:serine/threonine protein kinase